MCAILGRELCHIREGVCALLGNGCVLGLGRLDLVLLENLPQLVLGVGVRLVLHLERARARGAHRKRQRERCTTMRSLEGADAHVPPRSHAPPHTRCHHDATHARLLPNA
eukprot:1031642-Prymnesium_polylepis.1